MYLETCAYQEDATMLVSPAFDKNAGASTHLDSANEAHSHIPLKHCALGPVLVPAALSILITARCYPERHPSVFAF